MLPLRVGMVGTGFIASVMAEAIGASGNARLRCVASRDLQRARDFVDAHAALDNRVEPLGTWHALLAHPQVDALYIATPTSTKHAIAEAALLAGKHVLVEKPLASTRSIESLIETARAGDRVLMDATHFVHHPRTAALKAGIPELIGEPLSLHAIFHFPGSQPNNIRLDPSLEPTGALGDMGWYAMRALVEYLDERGEPSSVAASGQVQPRSHAVVSVGGLIELCNGRRATFDVGYTAGCLNMELTILGRRGSLRMDDFVLDATHGLSGPARTDLSTGVFHQSASAHFEPPKYIETPSSRAPRVRMIERFAELTASPHPYEGCADGCSATLRTQKLLDDIAQRLRVNGSAWQRGQVPKTS